MKISTATIAQHNGQFLQDFFVDTLLQKNNGFFVDIGCGAGDIDLEKYQFRALSNTYALEKYRNWKGLGIDCDKKYYEMAAPFRNKVICVDLLKSNINDVLDQNDCPNKIDYLSFDIDAAQRKVLDKLNFNKYEFDIITYEHNYSVSFDDHREYSRRKFSKLGYKMLIGNVGDKAGYYIEDWYVSQKLYDKYKYLSIDKATTKQIYYKLIGLKRKS